MRCWRLINESLELLFILVLVVVRVTYVTAVFEEGTNGGQGSLLSRAEVESRLSLRRGGDPSKEGRTGWRD
jgi:hypothetical protein